MQAMLEWLAGYKEEIMIGIGIADARGAYETIKWKADSGRQDWRTATGWPTQVYHYPADFNSVFVLLTLPIAAKGLVREFFTFPLEQF